MKSLESNYSNNQNAFTTEININDHASQSLYKQLYRYCIQISLISYILLIGTINFTPYHNIIAGNFGKVINLVIWRIFKIHQNLITLHNCMYTTQGN